MRGALRPVSLFSHFGDDDLDRLAEGAREISIAKGDKLFAQNDPGDEAYVITDGEIEIVKESVGRDVLLAVRRPGEVIGEMALLEEAPRMASARARSDATVIAIQKKQLDDLLDASPTAARAMFRVLLARWRETEVRLRQGERMTQLGTLTAGLAHEINNPASAVRRASSELVPAVDEFAGAWARVGPELSPALKRLLNRATSIDRPRIDALTRSDAEEAVEEWLADHDIPDTWNKTEPLVSAGIDGDALDSLDLTGDELVAAVDLLVASARAHDLLYQVGEASSRVFDIVQALKSYSFLDRAPVQDVDIAKGIDDTLLILRSKLKDIEVVRNLDGLPEIPAYGSELNQVWTNLVDNAADAIKQNGGKGTIKISSEVRGKHLVVSIEDDGPGIPDDVLPRVFDSFFTTKDPGKGTGLGLDISYGIVVNRHGGDITIDTEPGRTRFDVFLPIEGPPE